MTHEMEIARAAKWLGAERVAEIGAHDVRTLRREVQRMWRAKQAADRRSRHAAVSEAHVVDLHSEIAAVIEEGGHRVRSRVTRHPLIVVAKNITTPHGTAVRIVWDLHSLGLPYPGQRVIEERVRAAEGLRLHYYSAGQSSRAAPIDDMEQFAAMASGGARRRNPAD